MAKAKEYRDQSVEELQSVHGDLCKQLFELRNRVAEDASKQPHLMKQVRKDIARVLTVIREKMAVSQA